MLDDAEQDAFAASIERVRRRAGAALRAATGAESPVHVVAHLHRALDGVARASAAAGAVVACQAGCAACCRARVELGEPEVFALAEHLRARHPSTLPALIERLGQVAVARRVGTAAAPAPCALLVGARCSVYAVRPAVCRKAHSMSAQACESGAPTIPQHLRRIVDAESLMQGTAAAYRDQGLHVGAFELNAAVGAAIADPTLQTRWLAGQDVSAALAPDGQVP